MPLEAIELLAEIEKTLNKLNKKINKLKDLLEDTPLAIEILQ